MDDNTLVDSNENESSADLARSDHCLPIRFHVSLLLQEMMINPLNLRAFISLSRLRYCRPSFSPLNFVSCYFRSPGRAGNLICWNRRAKCPPRGRDFALPRPCGSVPVREFERKSYLPQITIVAAVSRAPSLPFRVSVHVLR